MGIDKKEFLDRRAKKLHRKKRSKKISHTGKNTIVNNDREKESSYIRNNQDFNQIIILPEIFSFQAALDDTVGFYSSMIHSLEKGFYRDGFLLDAQKVSVATADAIMYLIAIILTSRLHFLSTTRKCNP